MKRLSVVFLLLVAALSSQAQLSTNADKFLGNITTSGQVDYGSAPFYTLWNQLTAENESKWQSVERTRGSYNWAGSDRAYKYAQEHGIPFKFHTLVWGSQYPTWMDNLSTQEQYEAVVKWMDAIQARYPDLPMIDVVNEAVEGHKPAPFKEALGGEGVTGYDWIIKAFEMAHERWPNAILIYNDYNTFQWQRKEFIELVRTLRDAGAPIDAYGCQSHDLNDMDVNAFKSAMAEIQQALKMPMYSTEYDIAKDDDNQQLKRYQEQIPVMWEADYCAGITLWGYIYGKTWTTNGNSGIIRDNKDRPAMKWLREYMQTETARKAKSPFPGMKKEASLYVKPAELTVTKGDPLPITIRATLRTKTIDHVELYVNDELAVTLKQAPFTTTYTPTKSGHHNLRAVLVATDGSRYERWSGFTANERYDSADPNFYIYLCLGQSNMEGQAVAEDVDKEFVDSRFQTLACVDFTSPKRTKGQWYTAYPPIVRPWANVGMADYFGRTMVAALPSSIKVGVVDVAVGGVSIDGFMSEKVPEYLAKQESWMKNTFALYDNDPYKRLVEMAKIARQSGVIKGILLHQGESDNGQQVWLEKVKTIYNRLLKDLGLKAADVPLFAGEVVGAEVGGTCAAHNAIIQQLPNVIPTAHVVSSLDCPCADDHIHFSISGYRTMGKRYAYEALRVLGQPTMSQANYMWRDKQKLIYWLDQLDPVEDITMRVGGSKKLSVWGTFGDGHRENLTHDATFSSSDFTVNGNTLTATAEKEGTVKATYTDFFGKQHSVTIKVSASASGPNQVLVVNNGADGQNEWDKEAICKLVTPMVKGRQYTVRATIRADRGSICKLWPRYDASSNRDQWGNSADVQYLEEKEVSNTFQEVTWNFTAQYPHDVLIFAIGKLYGKVYFDDVSCMEQGGGNEMIANGTFDSDDISNWSILSWAGMSLSVQQDETSSVREKVIVSPGACGDAMNSEKLATAQWYTLDGRRLYGKPTQKGLYIANGRKIIIR